MNPSGKAGRAAAIRKNRLKKGRQGDLFKQVIRQCPLQRIKIGSPCTPRVKPTLAKSKYGSKVYLQKL
jgi:hypothetical protein